jgi:hypothetical protein
MLSSQPLELGQAMLASSAPAGGTSSTGREALLGTEQPYAVPVSDAGTRGLQQLQETQRIANDAQNLGMNILDQLGTQRGQIESAIDRRQQAHDGLSTSNRLIRQMHQRATWIKCSLCAIILILLGGIFLVVYLRWLDGHHSSHHPSPSPPSTGRALQVAAPPPPAAAVARSSTDLGAGLIILIVVGGLSLLACALSIPQNLVVRTAVFAASSFLCAAIFLTLLLMPRHGPPSAGATPTGKVRAMSMSMCRPAAADTPHRLAAARTSPLPPSPPRALAAAPRRAVLWLVRTDGARTVLCGVRSWGRWRT